MDKHTKQAFIACFKASFSRSTAFMLSWVETHDDTIATRAYLAQLKIRGYYYLA